MSKLDEFQIVILAGLLHDIGMFYQITGREPTSFKEFTEQDYGKHGAHSKWSKWSASFIDEYLPDNFKNAAAPILYHQNPKDNLAKILQIADHLSAVERIESEGEQPTQTRLLPILGRIFRPNWKEKGFYLRPLALDKNIIFPIASTQSTDLVQEYEDLWNAFVSEIKEIKKINSFDNYFFNLFYLLQKYTWCIRATWVAEPDISLFDHLKTTAAIVAVIYKSGTDEKFSLIGGDISGIQNFIYKLSSPDEAQSGMAQRLRGRSFYLSLLTETIALFILEKLGLPITNLLWCGGGQFTILAQTDVDLNPIRKEIDEFLIEKYRGELAMSLASIDINKQGLQDFGQSLNQLNHQLQIIKKHKFSELSWYNPFNLSTTVCSVCGKDITENCDDCELHENIGKIIPNSNYLVKMPFRTPRDNILSIDFEKLGVSWLLTKTLNNLPSDTQCFVYQLNNTEVDWKNVSGNFGIGFKFLAQQVPRDEYERIMTFETMQDKSEGAKFLGALRMDVDDLGMIFSFGLGDDRSLSRITSLSRSIDLFFSGYLNEIAKNRNIYILYSGGDDLFIVAPWNEAIQSAKEIYEEFKEYSGNNEYIHISGGIHLFKHKFPIGISANISKEKLDGLAKQHKENDREKDSLAVFEFPIFWNDAISSLSFANELITEITKGNLSHNFVYNLLQIYKTHFENGKENIGWIPKFLYLLKRNIPSKDEQGKDNQLYIKLFEKMPYMIKTTPIWANYVLLATRGKR